MIFIEQKSIIHLPASKRMSDGEFVTSKTAGGYSLKSIRDFINPKSMLCFINRFQTGSTSWSHSAYIHRQH